MAYFPVTDCAKSEAAGFDPAREGAGQRLLEGMEELLWPMRCVGCDYPGSLLCDDCRLRLPWICQRWACPVCGAPYGWLTCTSCQGDWEPRAVVCALSFSRRGVAPRLAAGLKDGHELGLAGVNAAAMATALDEAAGWPARDGRPRYEEGAVDAVCFVPATPEARRRRGFDHMQLTARQLACFLGLPVAEPLERVSRRDQRSLGREGRAANLAGSVRVVQDVSGLRLLLADDVVTTGSTLRECTRALLRRGAASVTCCALTRAW
ncbi:MAG: ComF family protein [Atopobiaceae bacterium]